MAITQIKIGDRTISVDTSIADRLRAANKAKITATGTPIMVTGSARTREQQAELHRRSQAGEIGRAAPPGMSFHETGKAVDVGDFEQSQEFLNRYGLRNDLEGDKGHFSIGETQPERFTSFAESVEKGRQRGFTDSQLLDVFVQKNPSQKKAVETAKQRYGTDPNIKNDRDLTNFLALRYSGVGKLQTPSVAVKEEVEVDEKGFRARVAERIQERGEVIEEKAELREEGKISLFTQVTNFASQAVGAVGDVAFEALVSATPDFIKDKVSDLGKAVIKTDIGQKGLKAAQAGVEKFEEFKKTNPEMATNIESLANFAEIIPVERGLGVGVRGVKKTAKIAPELAKEAVEAGVKGVKVVGEKGKVATKFGVSQATGLAPETIEQIIKNPEQFTKKAIAAVDRESLAKTTIGKIEDRINALKDTGKAYSAIRQSAAKVDITPNFIQDTLKTKYGLDIVDGKLESTTKSVTRNANDLKAIQNIVDDWGAKIAIDADEFLNFRSDLADLAKFDATKTKASQTVARGLRAELNTKFRKQIDGLKELDNAFATETKVLKGIKNDFFKKDGSLRDNAVSKLANLTGKGKEKALDRLKELVPNIEGQLRILKAIEDIKAAGGLKVGTYTRSFGGGLGVATGNIPLVIGAIISTPEIAVQLLRQYAKLKGVSKELVEKTINSIREGRKLVGEQLALFNAMISDKSDSFKKVVKDVKDN